MSKIIEGVWDCDYCGTKKIRGSLRDCPNCGHPRNDNTTFYMDEAMNYVEDPDKINKNPDWICSFCNSLNSDNDTVCKGCGASREDSELNYFTKRLQKEETITNPRRKRNYFTLLLPLILIFGLIAYIAMPKVKTISIDEKHWSRSVQVEVYQPTKDSGWNVPNDAWDVSSKKEIRSYNSVFSHYETRTREVSHQVFDGYDTYVTYNDLGNGYFEEVEHSTPRYRTEYTTETYQEPVYIQVPVYDTKYYYTVNKWTYKDTIEVKGTNNSPYDPDVSLKENERLGDTSESYTIISGRKTYETTYPIYQELKVGENSKVKIEGNHITSLE